MEIADITNKSVAELNDLMKESAVELQTLRFQAHGKQLKQVHKINAVRKTIARIATVLKAKSAAPKA